MDDNSLEFGKEEEREGVRETETGRVRESERERRSGWQTDRQTE